MVALIFTSIMPNKKINTLRDVNATGKHENATFKQTFRLYLP